MLHESLQWDFPMLTSLTQKEKKKNPVGTSREQKYDSVSVFHCCEQQSSVWTEQAADKRNEKARWMEKRQRCVDM